MRTMFVAASVFLAATGAFAAPLVEFAPGPDVQTAVQEAFILAEPGTTFVFAPGTYEFTMQLSIDVEGVTVRGAGMDQTVWDFSKQDAGSEGLYVTSDGVTLEDFAIEDTKGNAFKSNGADRLTLRRVRTEWTNGPSESNGAYGLYPVSSSNVLIDGCIAIGASDAGIYVGQTKGVIVRNSRAHFNVAGIEIENCHRAEVYSCIATRNTGGILVFDMPGLPVKDGHHVRVYNNTVMNNDTPNFAPAGNIVAKVPVGTGIMVMANTQVEIFGNMIAENQTSNISLISWTVTGNPQNDPDYYPYPEAIYIHNNLFGRGGWEPKGQLGTMAALLTGKPLPDIVWDGVVNPDKYPDGTLPAERGIIIADNYKQGEGTVTFANFDALNSLKDPAKAKAKTDILAHAGALPRLEPVVLEGLK